MTSHLRNQLMEGRAVLPRVGSVVQLETQHPAYAVLDPAGSPVESVTPYLRDLALNDNSPATSRSYANDLLRWFRFLWLLNVTWEKATEGEVAVILGWLRTAPNPQRRRTRADAPQPGSVNPRTGKRYLKAGYAPATINHALTVVASFYDFHRDLGNGPLVNPVPVSEARRRALAHRSPAEAVPAFRRSRLRQRVPATEPRAIPDTMWGEFFAAMNHDRDRAAVLLYVSSGARASELLGVTPADVDWPAQIVYVVSKGTKLREPIPGEPASPGGAGRLPRRDGHARPARAGLPHPPRPGQAAHLLGDAARHSAGQRPAGHELEPARPAAHGGREDGERPEPDPGRGPRHPPAR